MSVRDVDQQVHTLIHGLLLKGEENPANIHSVHLNKYMLQHQQQIQAIKNAIKPGVIEMYTKKFTLPMIIDYSKKVKLAGNMKNKEKGNTLYIDWWR